MKKSLIVLLVMVLAAGFAFAGVSGAADLRFAYNTAKKTVGFDSSNSSLNASFDLTSGSSETVGEGPVTAKASGSFALTMANVNGAGGNVSGLYNDDDNDFTSTYGLGVFAYIDELSVSGEGWKLAWNGNYQTVADFAKSAIDTYYGAKYDAFSNAYTNQTKALSTSAAWQKLLTGVTAEVAGFKAAVAGSADLNADTIQFTASLATPEFAFADGFKAKFAAEASKTAAAEKADLGASLQVAYAKDLVAVTAAGDFAYNGCKDFVFDASLKAAYDFVTVDAYYLSKASIQEYDVYGVALTKGKSSFEKVLSAKAVAKLDSFVGMPLSITVKGQDLLNAKKLSGEATVKFDAVTATISGGYKIKAEETTVGAKIVYAAELYTASAAADLTLNPTTKKLVPTVSVTSDKIVSGATIGLTWEKYAEKVSNKTTKQSNTNLLGLDKGTDAGTVYAFVKVAF